MENTLVEMMSTFIDLTEEEKQGILDAFPIKEYRKGSLLLKEGQIAKESFVIVKGCIRKYHLQDGEEITSEIYTELQAASDIESMINQKQSKYYLTCVEDTVVAIMNPDKENELYQKFPRFADVCRVEMEKMIGANHEQFLRFKNSSPKERYLNLIKERPTLFNRVPQYQIASYLGMKPETLSRIRKRISTQN